MIGMTGIGYYVPEDRITLDELGPDLDQERKKKIGIHSVPIEKKLTATQMAVRASREAMEEANVEPMDIDLIINAQASIPDYLMWQVSGAIQNELEAWNATFFDLYQGCSGFIAALSTAKKYLLADRGINTILVNSSEKWDASVPGRMVGGCIFGEGGIAVIVQRTNSGNILLGEGMICRGDLNDVSRMNFGAKNWIDDLNENNNFYYGVHNMDKAKNVMVPMNIETYYQAGLKAIKNSNLARKDINYMIFPNVDCGIFKKMADRWEIDMENTNFKYIRQTGDGSTVEAIANYYKMRKEMMITRGDHVLISSQGAGFTWAGLVIQV